MSVTQVDIQIPKDLTPGQRRELGDLIIEYIVARTEKGVGKDGNPWSGKKGDYSDEYKDSIDFKVAHKRGRVDLSLTGDMLAALEVIDSVEGKIRIGYRPGTEEEAKAEGNILGTYGQDKPIPGKARDFLGIEKSKLSEFVEYVKNGES